MAGSEEAFGALKNKSGIRGIYFPLSASCRISIQRFSVFGFGVIQFNSIQVYLKKDATWKNSKTI